MKAFAVISRGSACSGAGNPKGPSRKGPSIDRLPPGSIIVIVLVHLPWWLALPLGGMAAGQAVNGLGGNEHVLAVVDHLIHARMPVRARPPAQVAAPLYQLYAQPGLGQSASRAHASHAAADNDRRFFLNRLHCTHDPGRSLYIFPIIADDTPHARGYSVTHVLVS